MRKDLLQWLKSLGVVILLFLLNACGSSRRSIAVEEGWELLAEQKVNFVRDKDEIDIKNGQLVYSVTLPGRRPGDTIE